MSYKQNTQKENRELENLKIRLVKLEERVKTLEEILDYQNRYTKA